MSKLSFRLCLVGVALFLAAAACSLPIAPSGESSEAAQQTQAVQTLSVLRTLAANQQTETPSPGGDSTATPQGSTLVPSATPQGQATATTQPQACDQAEFVSDVSVPDGSTLVAGTGFTKTWRLKNTGTCTWTTDYALVFNQGSAMDGSASVKLAGTATPGQTIDVSIVLKAPGEPGQYRGYWKLRNASGVLFGIGPQGDSFYVDIKVVSQTSQGSGLDFAAGYCLAEWTGNNDTLPCSGKDGAQEGFVLYKSRPVLETGYIDDEPALITNPPRVNDGVIRGKYPTYSVQSGDHFSAIIGCEHNARNCNVRFQLDYQIDNGAVQTLASWNEAYEGSFSTVDVDLNSLAGKNVRFILTVLANGASDGDRAQWLLPRIARRAPTATPTQTATPTATP